MMNALQLHDVVQLIRMEYLEMPELELTLWQAQRLWNLSADLCDRSLTFLIGDGFLTRTAAGAYIRRDSPAPPIRRDAERRPRDEWNDCPRV